MQIIIPMSGFGERFRLGGYILPKPLIEVDGKPIIAHVIDMFPGELNFIFICNEDHLNNSGYRMAEILRQYCPSGRIIGIPAHKLGPIHAVHQVEHLIDPDRPVVVNYCDFTCYWNWSHFKEFVVNSACIGAIPAYKGFHPHTLGSTNYAYMRESNGWIQDIQEKQPYTDNRMEEFASSGTYYFASGKIMNEAFRLTMDQELTIGGEYYVSLSYKSLLKANHPVAVYPLQHFMQWGTPGDLAEYNSWSAAFNRLIVKKNGFPTPKGSVVIPMAGLGQRFKNEGYSVSKPLISVSGKSMVAQATYDLPAAIHYAFVLRSDMQGVDDISNELKCIYPAAIIKTIPSVTEGQACTALIGLEALECATGRASEPITFGACDNGVIYDANAFQQLADNPDVDIIVWGVRGHANAIRHPRMYGWIDANNETGLISHVSVKSLPDFPATDPIALGTFTFRRAEDFRKIANHLIDRDGRVNGEFYLDSCINDAIELGLRCYLFEVYSYLSWGTPNDLRTFEYWQSCFHKWTGHPYRLEKDGHVQADNIRTLESRYKEITPELTIKWP